MKRLVFIAWMGFTGIGLLNAQSLGWTPFSNQQERKISSGMRE
jgi:hypothetical protein